MGTALALSGGSKMRLSGNSLLGGSIGGPAVVHDAPAGSSVGVEPSPAWGPPVGSLLSVVAGSSLRVLSDDSSMQDVKNALTGAYESLYAISSNAVEMVSVTRYREFNILSARNASLVAPMTVAVFAVHFSVAGGNFYAGSGAALLLANNTVNRLTVVVNSPQRNITAPVVTVYSVCLDTAGFSISGNATAVALVSNAILNSRGIDDATVVLVRAIPLTANHAMRVSVFGAQGRFSISDNAATNVNPLKSLRVVHFTTTGKMLFSDGISLFERNAAVNVSALAQVVLIGASPEMSFRNSHVSISHNRGYNISVAVPLAAPEENSGRGGLSPPHTVVALVLLHVDSLPGSGAQLLIEGLKSQGIASTLLIAGNTMAAVRLITQQQQQQHEHHRQQGVLGSKRQFSLISIRVAAPASSSTMTVQSLILQSLGGLMIANNSAVNFSSFRNPSDGMTTTAENGVNCSSVLVRVTAVELLIHFRAKTLGVMGLDDASNITVHGNVLLFGDASPSGTTSAETIPSYTQGDFFLDRSAVGGQALSSIDSRNFLRSVRDPAIVHRRYVFRSAGARPSEHQGPDGAPVQSAISVLQLPNRIIEGESDSATRAIIFVGALVVFGADYLLLSSDSTLLIDGNTAAFTAAPAEAAVEDESDHDIERIAAGIAIHPHIAFSQGGSDIFYNDVSSIQIVRNRLMLRAVGGLLNESNKSNNTIPRLVAPHSCCAGANSAPPAPIGILFAGNISGTMATGVGRETVFTRAIGRSARFSRDGIDNNQYGVDRGDSSSGLDRLFIGRYRTAVGHPPSVFAEAGAPNTSYDGSFVTIEGNEVGVYTADGLGAAEGTDSGGGISAAAESSMAAPLFWRARQIEAISLKGRVAIDILVIANNTITTNATPASSSVNFAPKAPVSANHDTLLAIVDSFSVTIGIGSLWVPPLGTFVARDNTLVNQQQGTVATELASTLESAVCAFPTAPIAAVIGSNKEKEKEGRPTCALLTIHDLRVSLSQNGSTLFALTGNTQHSPLGALRCLQIDDIRRKRKSPRACGRPRTFLRRSRHDSIDWRWAAVGGGERNALPNVRVVGRRRVFHIGDRWKR